jgi:N-acetylmuramoyl-L-alanine amidase
LLRTITIDGFYHSSQRFVTYKMKFFVTFASLLALQLCMPVAQVEQKSPTGQATSAPPISKAFESEKTIVCIDPGHPSEVASGANDQHGTNEKHVAWSVALKLQSLLEARGYQVVMTKSAEDELVRNRDRALIANRARAALMVRLHCDASIEKGFAVYYPDRPGKTREGIAGPSPPVVERSRAAAEAIHAGMSEVLKGHLNDNGIRTDFQTKVGRDQGGALTGSIFSEVPVVTVEMVVLSDESDAAFIKADEGQAKMAEAIAAGVVRFVQPKSAPGRKP